MVGNGPQSSLTGNNAFIENITPIYETTYHSWLTWNRWGFARKKQELSQNATDPINEFSVSYQIPAEALIIFKVYPNVRYKIYGDDIFCNNENLEVDMIQAVSEGDLPAYFVEALVTELASKVAYAVTNNATLAGDLISLAPRMWSKAAAADAMQRSTEEVQDKPLIWSRYVS